MKSQRFKDTRTGEIVTQVPISEIYFFEEYEGPLQALTQPRTLELSTNWPSKTSQTS